MSGLWVSRLRRATRRPPAELVHHGFLELKALKDRMCASPLSGPSERTLPNIFEVQDIAELWEILAGRPFPISTQIMAHDDLEQRCPGEVNRIKTEAKEAMSFKIDLLGSGKVNLEAPVNWQTDFKNSVEWPLSFFRDIDVTDPERKSDIKVPWELSRLQWLTPVAQAYILEEDDRYAVFARDVLSSWIESNPYGRGPNWSVTMEAAMRVFTWTWLFHVFHASPAWAGQTFRAQFLTALYEHGCFCFRYLESFHHNGNHLTADAGALVFLGEFFPQNNETNLWCERGWSILVREIFRQVHADGTDYEGSTSYHRMVAELFLWPARYRRVREKGVPELYYDRLRCMAEFTSAYTKPDGTAPLWGDADDGRPYKFGEQLPSQHNYLPALISLAIDDIPLQASYFSSSTEIIWALGIGVDVDGEVATKKRPISRAFDDSGVYIMASEVDHVFIDCGPVGHGGRGGHGHNDCLSFEAVLNEVPVLTDSGTYVYTEDFQWRNSFRGTSFHNTPRIDQTEQNRFVSDEDLFLLRDDARPQLLSWKPGTEEDIFVGSHGGYEKLGIGIRPIRTIVLDKSLHGLVVRDTFEGAGCHHVAIPYHFVTGAIVTAITEGRWCLSIGEQDYIIQILENRKWSAEVRTGWISERYGVKAQRPILEFTRDGLFTSLSIGIRPGADTPDKFEHWMVNALSKSEHR